ncbi:CYIR protein [Plasmodium cynomolgi strain B]|uniref:CYIR protein n=1 Tax=Plasmodium cynomolgi (strain B) TaxID=1120755 RepID=K6UFF6_PLACD|nr:CYIR protein [Plasmodium cynomolgi strain B]GAB70016.1 CYIR protein [Plasmodium cynomolgi strain B]
MTDPVLDKLPSTNFLKALNGNVNGKKYSINCESIGIDSPEKEKINDICTKLEKNIYYLENEYNQQYLESVHNKDLSFFDKHCYDLNYWLYDELAKKLDAKIQKQWNSIDKNGRPNDSSKICNPESQLFKTGLFEYIKKLLDYFENFETFTKEMGTQNKEPNKYCDYIKKCVPLYFTFKQLCQLISNNICEKYLKHDDSYNPAELLSNLSCVEGNKYEVKLDESLVLATFSQVLVV